MTKDAVGMALKADACTNTCRRRGLSEQQLEASDVRQ